MVAFGYREFTILAYNRRVATCRECGRQITDTGSTTSNFIRHLKTHPDRFVLAA